MRPEKMALWNTYLPNINQTVVEQLPAETTSLPPQPCTINMCGPGQCSLNSRELKQRRRQRPRKTLLKKWICAASNFIALIPSRLIRQMLANFVGVEFYWKDCIKVQGEKKSCSRATTAKKCSKKRDAVQSRNVINLNLLVYCRSRWRRHSVSSITFPCACSSRMTPRYNRKCREPRMTCSSLVLGVYITILG